ncbi:hypothetical protein BKA56DRAFT_578558 [Ilyonectria sp. MPI-CAGE-AT-0026]|nr:hypothetical protein BKA56DRAFT_578558 [Ilyonectria sp. MPI-CAGE-AT-0026]
MRKRACDACSRRKIQCDFSETALHCNWCDHHGIACTFDRARWKPNNHRTKLGKPAERLERIEGVLARLIALKHRTHEPLDTSSASTHPSSATARTSSESSIASGSLPEQRASQETTQSVVLSRPADDPTIAVSVGQIHFAGCHLAQISGHYRNPVFSTEGQKWIFSRTGEEPSSQKLGALGARRRVHPPTRSASQPCDLRDQIFELPDRKIVEESLEEFQKSAFRLAFPVIDRVLFEESIRLAYEPCNGPSSLERTSARGCVLAFLSIICLFQTKPRTLPAVDTDACVMKVYHLLSDIIEDASLLSLQTVFMLHMHQTFCGHLQSAAMLHAVACRTVFMLGGHIYKHTKPFGADVSLQEREYRHLRMLFWLCYIFDKDIALRTGQLPIISDEYCDLTLPDGFLENRFSIPAADQSDGSVSFSDEKLTPYLLGDLRLSNLKGKTCSLLYSVLALKKSDAELLRDIRELDAELESWRVSIPSDYRPTLSIAEHVRFTSNMRPPQSMQRIGLQLEYHYLVTLIHRASGRCDTLNLEQNFDERKRHSVIQSSIALSVEASRSTLFYLRAVVDELACEAFWIIVFYPTAAILTLFFNILIRPLDPQAKFDLELLKSAADIIKSIPVWRLTPYEIEYVEAVDEFAAELVRLGNCAIVKEARAREQQKHGLDDKEVN